MLKDKIIACLLAALMLSSIHAIEFRSDGVFLDQDEAYGLLGAALSGGATYLGLEFLKPDTVQDNKRQLLFSGIAALIGGGIVYSLVSYFSYKNKKCYEHYVEVRKNFEIILVVLSQESLEEFEKGVAILDPEGFGLIKKTMNDFKVLLEGSKQTLEKIVDKTEFSQKERLIRLNQESKTLLGKVSAAYEEVLKRNAVIKHESNYRRANDKFLNLKYETELLLADNYVSVVTKSQNQVVMYGTSVVDKSVSLVEIIEDLRDVVKGVNAVYKHCIAQREICLQYQEDDPRFVALAKKYDELIGRIESEFPRTLFEQRIYEIVSSGEYKAQIQNFEETKRYQEQMIILHEINQYLAGLDKKVSSVENSLSRVRQDVSSTKNRLSTLSSDVSSLRTEFCRNDRNNHW